MTGPERDDDEPLPWGVVIPDDISALDAEVHAYQREARRRARWTRWMRRPDGGRPRGFGLSGPLVVAVLAVVALLGSLVALLSPRQSAGPAQRPLARQARVTPERSAGCWPRGPGTAACGR